jgi:transglutaminase superfamily protein
VTVRRRRLDLPTLRAALWAERALRSARRTLRRDGLQGIALPAPPQLPDEASRGVQALLRRRSSSTCLERALVRQRWLAAHGLRRDVVIAVQAPGDAFQAHAWLDGDADARAPAFHELLRVPAP